MERKRNRRRDDPSLLGRGNEVRREGTYLTMGQDVGGDFMVNLCVERNVEGTKICGLKCFFFFVLIVDFSIDQSEKVIA